MPNLQRGRIFPDFSECKMRHRKAPLGILHGASQASLPRPESNPIPALPQGSHLKPAPHPNARRGIPWGDGTRYGIACSLLPSRFWLVSGEGEEGGREKGGDSHPFPLSEASPGRFCECTPPSQSGSFNHSRWSNRPIWGAGVLLRKCPRFRSRSRYVMEVL